MDPRFDTSKDPRFKKVPQSVRRIKVDKRFAHMFEDKRFVETPKVDARGQRLRKDAAKSKLKEFYELADDKVDNQGAAENQPAQRVTTTLPRKARQRKKASAATAVEEELAEASDDEGVEDIAGEEDEKIEEEQRESESSDDSADESGDSGDDKAGRDREEGDGLIWENEEDVPKGDASTRLALMGCDWDHTSAGDLLVMLRTYLDSKESKGTLRTGTVERVAIYPSQYGLDQTSKEAQHGPQGLTETAMDEEDNDDPEKNANINEAMRRYQLQRTKYFYGVAFCDSVATASWLYDQLDGLDAQGICPATMDLRFVPDDLEFPHPPREEATKMPSRYQGPTAQKSALGHTKVQCSWDEGPAHRKRDLMRKRFTPQELEQMDLDAYLASSSDDAGREGAEELKKLVRGDGSDSDFFNMDEDEGSGKEVEGDMEATFNVSATKLEEELAEKAELQRKTENGVGGRVKKLESDQPKSTWAAYLEKRKEKRKERKAKAKADRASRKDGADAAEKDDDEGASQAGDEAADEGDLELLAMDAGEEDDRGFNVRGKLRTAKKRAAKNSSKEADGEFRVNVEDPRIARVFASGDFEIDPTNPEFRPSSGMKAVLKKKRERKIKSDPSSEPQSKKASLATAPVEGSTTSVDAQSSGRMGGAVGNGGLQIFASRRTASAGEGKKSLAANSETPKNGRPVADSGGIETTKKLRVSTSQDVPVAQDAKPPPTMRKKKRA